MLQEKNQADVVEYSGRKTSRKGSELRRKAILEAALRIVVRDGVRGVRHRAVAKEAEVPLSATTYYFKDISDLIADTFVLFAENTMTSGMNKIKAQLNDYLQQCDTQIMSTPEGRSSVIDQLSHFLAAKIVADLLVKREHLMAEHAFILEALRDDRLRTIALSYKHSKQMGLVDICKTLGSTNAIDDAWIVLNSILQIEKENLLRDNTQIDCMEIESKLGRLFTALFG